MDDLLQDPAPLKKKRTKKLRPALKEQKHHGINVHVNVVNQAGDGHKKTLNPADDALGRLRGY